MKQAILIVFVAAVGAAAGAAVITYFSESLRPDAVGGPPAAPASGPPAAGPPGFRGPPPAAVRVDRADQQVLQDRWNVVGRLQEVRRTTVDAEVMGRIDQVLFEEGQHVEGPDGDGGPGTVLVRIDPVWNQLEQRAAEAALARTEADEAEALARLQRSRRHHDFVRQLVQSNSAQAKEGDDAFDQMTADEARHRSAQRRADSVRVQRDRVIEQRKRLEVKAPFSGYTVRKLVEVGQWVEAGTSVAEIVSSGDIYAVIDVPERLINHVRHGQTLEVHVEALGADAFEGKVAAIVPLGASQARTFPVKIRMANPQGAAKPGMSVNVGVPTGAAEPVLTVPRDAVLRTPSGPIVWLGDGEVAKKVAIEVLFGTADRYAVRALPGSAAGALVDGAVVVIEGGERIFMTGQRLAVMPPLRAASSK